MVVIYVVFFAMHHVTVKSTNSPMVVLNYLKTVNIDQYCNTKCVYSYVSILYLYIYIHQATSILQSFNIQHIYLSIFVVRFQIIVVQRPFADAVAGADPLSHLWRNAWKPSDFGYSGGLRGK